MDWFLVGVCVGVAAAIVLAVADVFWPFTVALALAAIGLWWWEHVDVARAWLQPPYVAAYFGIGIVWVFFKWTRFVEKEWRSQRGSAYKSGPPEWSAHSYDFAAYFFYWPVDVIAYALSDLLREAWRFVSRVVGRSFDRYAEWRFAGGSDGR